MHNTDTQPTHDLTSEVNQLKADLAQRDRTVAEQSAQLNNLRTRHAMELQLRDAGTVDMEAALALAERALASKPQASVEDVSAVTSDLQRMRPWLFRGRHSTSPSQPTMTGVQSAAGDDAAPNRTARLQDAAADAAVTGNRMDLLRYLRLRRKR